MAHFNVAYSMRNQLPLPHLWLLIAITFIPSLAILNRLSCPYTIIPLTLALIAVFITILTHPRPNKAFTDVFTTPWPAATTIIALALSTIANHQAIPTFIPSGWNLLLAPLGHIGMLPLLTPLTLAFTIFIMRTTQHPWPQINRFTLVLFSCLLMWPDGAADLPALGLLILSLTLLLTRQRIHWLELCALILLLACASTARAIFIYLPLLMGFSLAAVWPKRALAVTLGGAAFLLIALKPIFPIIPVTDLTSASTLAAIALLIIVTIQSVYHWRWWPAPQHAAWGLGAPLMVVALSNLSETASFANWYGAIYLTATLPVVIYTLLRPTLKHS